MDKRDVLEHRIEKIVQNNQKYFDGFEEFLKNRGLKEKTIEKHLDRAMFFLNGFVAEHLVKDMENADNYTNDFMQFLIDKCLFCNEKVISEYIYSIRLFYKSMYENDLIDVEEYEDVYYNLKESKSYWLDVYNSKNEFAGD